MKTNGSAFLGVQRGLIGMSGTLMHPDAGEAAGDGAAPIAAPAPDEGNKKVVVNGKEYTPEQLQAALSKAAEADEFQGAVGRVLDATVPEAEREKNARLSLAKLGYNRQQIDEWVNVNVKGVVEQEEGNVQQDTPTPSNNSNQSAVERRLELAEAELRGNKRQRLNDRFEKEISKVLDTHTGVATLLKAATRLQGADKAGKARDALKNNLTQAVLGKFRERMARTGESLSEDWIGEEMGRAVPEVVEQFAAVIGDPSALGRGTETSNGSYSANRKPPVKAPVWTEESTVGGLEKQITDWFTDDLSRAAEEVDSMTAGSKI